MSLAKKIKARAKQGPRTETFSLDGETITFSSASVSWEERSSLLFPDPTKIGHLADSLRISLDLQDFPDDLVISALAIIALWPSEESEKPEVADLVAFALNDPAEFQTLDYAASKVLGMISSEQKRDGLFEWKVMYTTLRRVWQLLESGDTDKVKAAIKEAGQVAKSALADNAVTVSDVDSSADDPIMETLRGNSEEASSDGALSDTA